MLLSAKTLLPLALCFACVRAAADTAAPAPHALDAWAAKQFDFSVERVFAAIRPKPDAAPGTVMASPTAVKPNPDYYYHWVRDSALTMDAIASLLDLAHTEAERNRYRAVLNDFNALAAKLQATPVPPELKKLDPTWDASQFMGEPKWMMDGTPYLGPWTRPQNDGPASRAFALAHFTKYQLHRYSNVKSLYDPAGRAPMQVDLDYVVKNWRKPSYEIWEEVKGTHFYTLMVQRRALVDGAMLATRLNDTRSAQRYRAELPAMEREIRSFWHPGKHIIRVTKARVAGLDYKRSELDAQVLLAALHASNEHDDFFTPANDKIHATFVQLARSFAKLYKNNRDHANLAPAIGRYPEDKYNGYDGAHGGNGWMLLTAAMAEVCYRTKLTWRWQHEFRVTGDNVAFLQYVTRGKLHYRVGERVTDKSSRFAATLDALVATGDRFLDRVRVQTERDGGHMNEQWNKDTGKQQGAADLTWSYVAYITAYLARQRVLLR